MKKTLFIFALLAFAVVFMSGVHDMRNGLKKGEMAPEIELVHNQAGVKLSEMRGKYVLLTFWSSTDADSRIENSTYTAWIENKSPLNLSHVSVNFDQPALFSAVKKRDKLNETSHFNVIGKMAKKIEKDYGLSKGYGSLLIGPDGRIVEFDPSISEITALL